jgi:alpha-tubulin suppressor-like RCC1 family protein
VTKIARINEVPAEVNDSQPIQVSAGSYHACAVLANGSISCWGGYSGTRSSTAAGSLRAVPVASPDYSEFTQVTAGDIHDCGILNTGRVLCWGKDTSALPAQAASAAGASASAALLTAPRP